MRFNVTVCHDVDAAVWYVQDSDLPGLNAEARTLDELVAVIEDVAPDLAYANLPPEEAEGLSAIPICIQHLVTAKRAFAA
jgi:hypothetical protein